MKIIEEYCKNKQKINVEIYLEKKKMKKGEYRRKKYENMSEQEKQRLKEYEKPIGKQKNWHNKFYI